MSKPHFLTITEQIAEYLRGEILRGRWPDTIPGLHALADELEVNYKTVDAALNLLEGQKLLVRQGAGKRRKIILQNGKKVSPSLRIGIFNYSPSDLVEPLSLLMTQKLKDAGHLPFYSSKTLTELAMNLTKIRKTVANTEADAWIVCAGTRQILTWFSEQKLPVMAMFGRRRKLPMAGVGPNHVKVGRSMVQQLIELGHQRIVVLIRDSEQIERAGRSIKVIFDTMEENGLPVGPYNLPSWNDCPEDFYRMLDELFRITPPTALIIHEAFVFHAAKDYLAHRGILAPADISLICGDPDPTFAWSNPSIAHIQWSNRPVVRRVVGWANNIRLGKMDTRQTHTLAEFIIGDTVGPAST
jgi:DNA-binding LacI/PurR family transcriptional regulator